MGHGLSDWSEVMVLPELKAAGHAAGFIAALDAGFDRPPSNPVAAAPLPTGNKSLLDRLLKIAPCLANQADTKLQARGVVHFCELTLDERITAANVEQAFLVQHPHKGPDFAFPPVNAFGGGGGTVMELLCSEVLASAGIPAMEPGTDNWPVWSMPGHVLLNDGRMSELQALGDILVPCAPTNLLISVKSEKARERLLYSANSIEGIGFGFFDEPEEFWTESRMQLYKRMGFSAIYMPGDTVDAIHARVGTTSRRLNVYGTELYRPITTFADDMNRIVGRSAFAL